MSRACLAAMLCALPVLADAQPVTGPYASATGGVNFLQDVSVNAFSIDGRSFGNGRYGFDPGFAGRGSLGYGLGNGLRVEIEGNYRGNDVSGFPDGSGARSAVGREEKYGPMANALFDLDLGLPWLPYVGIGAGYQWTHLSQEILGPAAEGFRGGTDGRFAYQAMLGASLPLAALPGLSLTAEYRFLGLAGDHDLSGYRLSGCNPGCGAGVPATSNVRLAARLDDDFNHALLIGLRYAFEVAPPAPAPSSPPAAAPAPAPEASRTYLVFFDWDRSALSEHARELVADAAQASRWTQTTRIEVGGYADRSGTAVYNQGLSLRRARAVGAELVHDGVPAQTIDVQGFGEDRPLVPTADGVREPQNRRVEIVLR